MDLMKDLEGIETYALDQLREAQRSGDTVSLPFPAPYIYVHNGNPAMKSLAQSCPIQYFGGWATDATALGELVEAGSVPAMLKGWVAFSGAGDRGEYNNVGTRSLTFSFVGKRKRWLNNEGESGPHFDKVKGLTRQHLQVLALLYSESKPWGYAVLTAKGFQAMNLTKALDDWQKAIAPFLKELNGTQLPISAFALTVGTAGDAPNYTSVGKGAQSKITPVGTIIPPDLTAEKVGKRFIGGQNITANADRLAQAKDWLLAWGIEDGPRAEAPAEQDVQPTVDW